MFLKKELKLILISSIFLLIFFFLIITASSVINFEQSVIRVLNADLRNPIHNIELEKIETHWGSGFFIIFEDDFYIVTARHVVDNNYDLIGIARLLNKSTNKIEIFEINFQKNNWIFHPENYGNNIQPVDVALTKINQLDNYEITAFECLRDFSSKSYIDEIINTDFQLPKEMFICKTFGWLTDLNIKEWNKYDPTRPMPTFISSNKEGKVLQQKYLRNKLTCNSYKNFFEDEVLFLEGNVYPGNSGSPVIALRPIGNPNKKLIGIVIASEKTRIEDNRLIPEIIAIEPAYRILETLIYSKSKIDKLKDTAIWKPVSIKLFKNM